ncbi:MAG TPA: hypothetical protein VGO18_37945 [Steroidobacteraceae bacterium]|nr:hypothetical protein [Steroidobacteraceae bacterium]
MHDKPRTLREIYDAEKEYFDKIWYARSLIYDERVERKDAEPLDPEIAGQEDAAMKGLCRPGGRRCHQRHAL